MTTAPYQPVGPPHDDASVGQLIGDVTSDLSRLFRQEVELAKAEMRQEATKAGKAAGMFTGAGVAGLLTATLLSLALVALLDQVMPWGWAATIVGLIWAVVAGVLYARGRQQMRQVSPVPRQTVETLKEDVQWARNPTK